MYDYFGQEFHIISVTKKQNSYQMKDPGPKSFQMGIW